MRTLLFILLVSLVSLKVGASPKLLTYQGRIVKNDGTPLEFQSVSFLFEITNPDETCVLYREQVDGVNMKDSGGLFDVPIGNGTKLFPASSSVNILTVFANTQKLDCADANNNDVGDYNPVSGDVRFLKVKFHDGLVWNTLSSGNEIRTVPYAAFAHAAETLGDKQASDFLLKSDFTDYVSAAACGTSQTMYWNSANDKFECQAIAVTLAGDVTGASGATKVGALQGYAIGTSAPSSNQVLTWNGSQWTPADLPAQSGGTVTGVSSANSDIGVSVASPNPVLTLNSGLMGGAGDANKIAKLNGSGLLSVNMIPSLSAGIITSGTLPIANGGTGASTDMGARSNLGLGTAATKNVGTSSGELPVLGVAGIVANKMCTSDGSSGLICNSSIPTSSQWVTSGSNISYTTGSVGIGTANPSTTLEVSGSFKFVDGNQGLNKVLTSDANGVASWQVASGGSSNALSILQARAATTSNISLSGLQTIDGVALANNDRVLVMNQTNLTQNGLYVASSSSWSRTTDMDDWTEVVSAAIQVKEGNSWRNSFLYSDAPKSGTLGSTNLWFVNLNSGMNNLYNVSVGSGLIKNTSGTYNVALGNGAMYNNQSGYESIGIGYNALRSQTTAGSNLAVGVNSVASVSSNGYFNVGVGNETLRFTTTGSNNTAIGYRSLAVNSTAGYNTGLGAQTLFSTTTGDYNTALGGNAMQYNVIGGHNVAVGVSALLYNVGKSESTAVGYNSMVYADSAAATSVTYNTALGAYSLYGSTTAANNTGTQNTALGHSALRNYTSGSGNVAIGYNAGSGVTTGSNNVIIGSNDGASIAASSNNILIADGAGNERLRVDSSGNMGLGKSPSYKLDVNGSINIAAASALLFGGTSVCTSAGCSSPSDKRLKENILPLQDSLDKVLRLQGVHYDYRDKDKFGDKHQIGVIAQDVEKIFPEIVITDQKTGFKSVAYDHLVAPLIESVKTLFHRVVTVQGEQVTLKRQVASKADKEETDAKIQALKNENELLKARLEKLEKAMSNR